MKKLMIAAAIVCAAVLAQASTANWRWTSSSTTTLYSYADSSVALAKGTLYIFLDGKQQDVYDQWKTDGTMLAALDHKDIDKDNPGRLPAVSTESKDFSTDPGSATKQSFFTALIDDSGNLFIGNTKSNVAVNESDLGASIQVTFGKSTLHNGDSYTGAGWYSAVPEPTSGLLLLLGVAGLALRRRRA